MTLPDEVTALTIVVGSTEIALDARRIHAIHGWRHHPPPTPLPDSPSWLIGLIDGPEGLAPVVHLERLAGAPPRQDDRSRPRLILCRHRPPLALRVERARGVCRITAGPGAAGAPPAALAPFLEGGWRRDERPIWRLDLPRLAEHLAKRS